MQRGTLDANKSIISPEAFAQCWGLDSTGNWQNFQEDDNGDGSWDLVQGRAANPVNEITLINNTVGSSWVTPTYDSAGNMTTMSQPAAPGSSFTAVYDAWNRLVSLSSAGSTVVTYAYDGLKRRTVKESYSGGMPSETRHYFYSSGWQVLEERVGGGTPPAERQFVWGLRYVDDLVLRDRDSTGGGSLNERLFACQDPNWNLTAVSDSSGTIQERYAYSAYGEGNVLTPSFVVRMASLYDWEVRFAGYRWDGEGGLYQVRNRAFQAILGIWSSRDSIGLRDGMNLYCYLKNRCLNDVDPFGKQGTFGKGPRVKGVIVKRLRARPQYILLPDWKRQEKETDEDGGIYGHWWLEIQSGEDVESYGWYPDENIKNPAKLLGGVKGVLNNGFEKDPDEGKKGDVERYVNIDPALLRFLQFGPRDKKGKKICCAALVGKTYKKKAGTMVIECLRAAAEHFSKTTKVCNRPVMTPCGAW
jgi:RHS repeat-associated protein